MVKILAHYMPWFKKRSEGERGVKTLSHWHGYGPQGDGMNTPFTCQHESTGQNGIASNYYPSKGTYHSDDKTKIAVHIDMMRKHGISGLVVDWNGVGTAEDETRLEDSDFKEIHETTKTIVDYIEDMKSSDEFSHSVCFDCNCEFKINEQNVDPQDYVTRSLEEAARRFMKDRDRCLTHRDSPLVFVFGNPTKGVLATVDWEDAIRKAQKVRHFRIVAQLHHHDYDWVNGAFLWLPVSPSGSEDIIRMWDDVQTQLDHDYDILRRLKEDKEVFLAVGVAFPGVNDIYLDDRRSAAHLQIVRRRYGQTLERTLATTKRLDFLDYVQIATFNDWNEGTQIEPAEEYGDRYLDIVRDSV